MLFHLAAWMALGIAAQITGAALFVLAGEDLDRPEDCLIAQLWTGLFSLASLLLALSLLHPLTPAAGFATLACVLLLPVSRRVRANIQPPTPALSIGLLAILLAAAWDTSNQVDLYDTALYHYQFIRWLHETGTVRGLALIHYRFAFSSAWLTVPAIFDSGPFTGRALAVLNGFAFALICFQYAVVASRILRRSARAADIFLAAAWPIVLYVFIAARFQISPSPNFPVAIGIVVASWMGFSGAWNLALILAGGAVAAKLSALPLLAILAIRQIFAGQRKLVLALAAAIALPIFAANFIASGCPLFPSTTFCEPISTIDVAFETTNWARYTGPYPSDASFFQADWFRPWIHNRFHALYFTIMLLGLAASLCSRILPINKILLAIGLVGSLWLFVVAPDPRFAIGYPAVIFGAIAAALYRPQPSSTTVTSRAFLAMAAAACIVLLADSRHRDDATQWSRGRLLVPLAMVQSPEHWAYSQKNGVTYSHPIGDNRCFGLPRPCTPYPLDAVRFCDPDHGARGGFCRK